MTLSHDQHKKEQSTMRDWTTQELETVIANHREQKVRMLAAELLALHADIKADGTEIRKTNLLEMGRDLTALLHHEILRASCGDEDFVNDQEYM